MSAATDHATKRVRLAVTVDCAVFAYAEGEGLQLLLIQRGAPPFLRQWALPGGFVHETESLEEAALRGLAEETGFQPARLQQLRAYGAPERDPRGRVISIAFLALVRQPDTPLRSGTDAARAAWFPVGNLPHLAFDHHRIFRDARQELRNTIRRGPASLHLLPEAFTLTQLQSVYEAALGTPLDKRNFRKKILKFGVLHPLEGQQTDGPRRPAQLYAFDEENYEEPTPQILDFKL